MKKRYLILLLCLFSAGLTKADNEPGNNLPGTTTDALTLGGTQAGSVGPGDNDDYYQIVSGADGNITISLSNDNNVYTYIYLYDSNGATQLGTTSGNAQSGISFTVNGLQAGTYYARVLATSSTNYTLSGSIASPPQANDTEPNNSPATALSYVVNSSVEGHIAHYQNGGTYDNDDYYVFTTATDGNITVSLSNNTNNYTYIYLYDDNGTTQLGSTSGNAQGGIAFTTNGLAAGTYYLRVLGTAGQYAGYTLSATLAVNPIPNDPTSNSFFINAPSFAQNDSIYGHVAYRLNGGAYDNNDYYSFYSNGDYDITISLKNDNNNYTYIYLYDTDTVTQLGSTSGNAVNGISFTTNGLAAGTYYIKVFGSNGQYCGYTLKNSYTVNPIANDIEPNNTPAQATSVSYSGVDYGHVAYRQTGGGYDNDDYYVFTTPIDGNINLSLTNNNNLYTYLYLYDSNGTTQLTSTSGNAAGGIGFTYNGLAAGTYYARVFGGAGQYTGYTLTKSLTATPFTNDPELNDDVANASPLNVNSIVNGHIAHRINGGSYDNYDYYELNTSVDGNITINFSNNTNNYNYVYLYDNNGTTQLGSTSGSAQSGIGFTVNGLAAGTYYVAIFGGTGQYAGYTLSNTLTPTPNVNDSESNDGVGSANSLTVNSTVTGHIAHRLNGGSYDNYDYYQLITPADGNISISLTNNTNNYTYIYLYDDNGTTQLGASSGNAVGGIGFTVNGLAAGTYYVVVYGGASQYAGYTLTNSLNPTPFNNDTEPNNSFATATPLNNNPNKEGHMGHRLNGGSYDNDDYWKITMLHPDSLRLDLTMANTNYSYVYVYNGAFGQIYAQSGNSSSYSIFFPSLAAGDYYLRVYGGATQYNGYSLTNFYFPCNTDPSVISAGGPTTFCDGGSVTLSSAGVYNSYSWSNGSTLSSINATVSGGYSMTGYDFDGCPHFSNSISVNALTNQTWYQDGDNDGYGNPAVQQSNCVQPSGYVLNNYDCNDGNNAIHPGAAEVCGNGIDDDCDTQVDNGCGTFTYFADDDHDTYGDPNDFITSTNPTPPAGYVTNNLDCNDGNANIKPGATEICNGIDDNCDGAIDNGVVVDDGNACTNDFCGGIAGVQHTPVNIDDNNACTTDGCDPLTGVFHNAVNTNDNNACTDDGCNPVTGIFHNPVNTNDNNACTDDGCNPSTGVFHNPVNTNDNNACTDDGCNPSTGVFHNPVNTNDNNACTTDACDPSTGVFHNPVNTNDNNACTTDACDPSTGISHTPVNTNDNNACTTDGCDPVTGVFHNPVNIDDGNPCTKDACDPLNGVSHNDTCNTTCNLATPGAINGAGDLCSPVGGATFSILPVPGATSYSWSVPSGTTIVSGQGTTSIYVSWTFNAIHFGVIGQVCVVANNNSGCSSAQRCDPLTVQLVAPVQPSSISGPAKACPGDTFVYSSFVSRATYYTWTAPANASVINGQGTTTVTIAFGTGFNATSPVTVVASNGCGAGPARSRNIQPNALPAIAAITGPADGVCGMSGVMYCISAPVAGAISYLWTVTGTGATINGSNTGSCIIVDFTNVNSAVISVVAVNGCGSSLSRNLTVTGKPAAADPISGPTSVCVNSSYVYSVGTVSGANTYTWTVPGGTTIMAGQGTKVITLKYAVLPASNMTVAVKTSNTCGVSAARQLNGISSTGCIRDGDNTSLNVNVVPNPSAGKFKVDFNDLKIDNANVTVFDMQGRTIISQIMTIENESSHTIDLSSYDNGIYMMLITNETGTQTIRLMKQQ